MKISKVLSTILYASSSLTAVARYLMRNMTTIAHSQYLCLFLTITASIEFFLFHSFFLQCFHLSLCSAVTICFRRMTSCYHLAQRSSQEHRTVGDAAGTAGGEGGVLSDIASGGANRGDGFTTGDYSWW